MSWPWEELGLSGPAGLPDIRRAYAQRLKAVHPEEDPEGFQRLHTAYQEASRYARQAARTAQPEPSSEPEPGYGGPPEGREAPDKPPEAAREPAWDDGGLPEGTEGPPEPDAEEAAAGWDYERLFAEGEAEAQEARRRKLEDLRWKNRARYPAQERAQRIFDGEGEAWTAVMAAAQALELLYAHDAPLSQWQRFLSGPAFRNVQANLDFVFALEDFLERCPDLSPEVRRAVFLAYEAQNGSKYPVYRRLYRLLGVKRTEVRRIRNAKSPWRNAWRSYPPWRKTAVVICFSILGAFFLLALSVSVRDACRKLLEEKTAEKWEAQSLAWLEEDFGEPFTRPLGGNEYKNIYAPASDPSLYFWLLQDGERAGDRPGYRTDYPHIRVMRAMEDFAGEWNLQLKLDSAGGGFRGGIGDAPGAYLFDLPLQGAGEAITALGELIGDLQAQDWYRVLEDRYNGRIVFQVFLCHRGLSFYDAITGDESGGFDADYARAQYETQAGGAFCRYLLERSGLAARHMGEDAYILLDQGTVEIGGSLFFRVSGLDKESCQPQVQYLLASGGGMLFCLPEGRLEQISGIVDLYRGNTSHLQLEGAGLVTVLDQVGTG